MKNPLIDSLPKNWYKKISKKDIEHEAEIIGWQHPEVEAWLGLATLASIVDEHIEEVIYKDKIKRLLDC